MEASRTPRLIALGVALAIPLAAVAVYFAVFEPAAPVSSGAGAPPPVQTAGASLPPNHPPVAGDPQGEKHPQVGGTGRVVKVPDAVKGKWEAVRLQVEQKDGGRAPQIFTVKLGGALDIPGSKLRVQIGDFLPALQVKDNEVTSSSNEPTNPAVQIRVAEGGREAFHGWLFSKFPGMQPFEHQLYRITLVEGVPKS